MISGLAAVTPIRFPLTKQILDAIGRIGRDRLPNEACGLILPPPGDASRAPGMHRQVIELPNRSSSPRDSYEIGMHDIEVALEKWGEQEGVTSDDIAQMVVWHTHPSGHIGPSRGDMRAKASDLAYLVVTLLTDGTNVHSAF
jgi:proteasome lid subunit RPN8/RPN11